MTQYAAQNGTDDTDKLIAYAHALATRYGEAAAALACQMYDQTAAAAGAAVPPAEPADTATYGETAAAILGTLKQSTLPQSVGNSTGRLVKQAASDTTLKNAKRDHAEFAWIPSGDGCPYCMMIASNGWRPASKATANGGHADHIHPNCQCEFAIRFSRNDGVAGYDPDKYKRIFEDTDGDTWSEKIRSLDRERYAENADTIKARKRAEYRQRTGKLSPDEYAIAKDLWNKVSELQLNGAEKEHVYEELDNNLTAEEKSMAIVCRSIGNYQYSAVQLGHNQYKIYKKEPLDKNEKTWLNEILSEVIGPDWRQYED